MKKHLPVANFVLALVALVLSVIAIKSVPPIPVSLLWQYNVVVGLCKLRIIAVLVKTFFGEDLFSVFHFC